MAAVYYCRPVGSHALEEAIDGTCQGANVAVVDLISQTSQRLSPVDCLASNELDTTPPGPRVTVAQSLQFTGVILPPQRPQHSLYSVPVRTILRRLTSLLNSILL